MTILFSTALAAQVLGTSGLKGALPSFFIDYFAGPVPTSADADATTGTILLGTISVGGDGLTGLSFGDATGGGVSKDPSQVWSGTNIASGTPSFYRLRVQGDTNQASTTALRVQGSAGPTGDLLTTQTIAVGDPQSIDVFNLSLPVAVG